MKTIDKEKPGNIILTDSGLETTLIYHHNIALPHFAAFILLNNPQQKSLLDRYFRQHLDLAVRYKTGFVLESVSWRANSDWGYKLGYQDKELDFVNQKAIRQLFAIKNEYAGSVSPIYVSGCIGPRSDGYQIKHKMTPVEAKEYHINQVASFKKAKADFASALTMNYSDEAMGIVLAAREKKLPVVISFTVETDGSLPDGEKLDEAISRIDKDTQQYPLYYMINCAHPTHFVRQLVDADWTKRIRGIRANASCKSHAELDESVELDSGNKIELADWYTTIREKLPNLLVYGGCCGTDISHIENICQKIAV
ncbi:homocysteine S-methyltransferase [Maribellus comscasis]|uniref:Homocysteine S-methyltransferase n=1 Tax=Maribellus comscasis TaxID=2681766 RepID=A0A6I6JU50_9BACT|nr:homocysteine S-methyltransferase family protein [Maribellus comscasis]QGY43073.1 homocysteine S-methyltransferase [Maribellus comscasis]